MTTKRKDPAAGYRAPQLPDLTFTKPPMDYEEGDLGMHSPWYQFPDDELY